MATVVLAALSRVLAAIKAGLLDVGTLDLFQNDVAITPLTAVGDLTVATFSGYAQKALTLWSAPVFDGAGNVVSTGPQGAFLHNGGVVSNIVYGYWVEDANGDLLMAERFPVPLPMAVLGDGIFVTPRYLYGEKV